MITTHKKKEERESKSFSTWGGGCGEDWTWVIVM